MGGVRQGRRGSKLGVGLLGPRVEGERPLTTALCKGLWYWWGRREGEDEGRVCAEATPFSRGPSGRWALIPRTSGGIPRVG